jgi:DNA-binding MarR family transcriptional regulator
MAYYKQTVNNSNNNAALSQLEIQILKSIKSKSKTEKKIAKQVALNTSAVSQLITSLMLKGFIERTRKRRLLFSSTEYFSATIEGVMELEMTMGSTNIFSWNHILKEDGERMILGLTNKSLVLRLTFEAIKTTYKLAKFTLR